MRLCRYKRARQATDAGCVGAKQENNIFMNVAMLKHGRVPDAKLLIKEKLFTHGEVDVRSNMVKIKILFPSS